MGIFKELLSSKKAIAAAAGVLVVLAGRFGLDLPEETAVQITGIVVAYLLGQGLADVGKETRS